MKISDSHATQEATDLFYYLESCINCRKILFGQQHATDAGESLTKEDLEAGGINSDVKSLIGKNPAVIGWDAYLCIAGKERPGIKGDPEKSVHLLAKSMNAVHDQGSIIVLSMHPDNFVTGGPYNDLSGDPVTNILPGGSAHEKFNKWLDYVVELSKLLKDKSGKQYAVIFRPFHEQTGDWFWWGTKAATVDQYKYIYKYIVTYFRSHGVHNFLYAYTPGADMTGDEERYLRTYPGDDYVDLMGIDIYDCQSPVGTAKWREGLIKDLEMVVKVAKSRNKIPALSEYGRHLQNNLSNVAPTWYTDVLNEIEMSKTAWHIVFMYTWANFGYPDNIYVPYKNFVDQLVVADFEKFIDDQNIVMCK